MISPASEEQESLAAAHRWCQVKGSGWAVKGLLGRGGTAPVYELETPEGLRALKLHPSDFSDGAKGAIELARIEKQLELAGHECSSLVNVYEGGCHEGRLFVLMSRATGTELEKCLPIISRDKIRLIMDQVAQAAIFLRNNGLCHRDIKAANVFISSDHARATLLDVSVIRDLIDPVGVGTDHEGQLPIVATARYSPPEYLFRLLETGPELWHALTIYQLGALLHDLIMREPMFQSEYARSAVNRYRFAWIVATETPRVDAGDVDEDLLLLARRALDKDWRRRSALRLEDFLEGSSAKKQAALQLLGFQSPVVAQASNTVNRLRRVTDVARELEQGVLAHLKDSGVQAKHKVDHTQIDTSKELKFSWETPPADASQCSSFIELKLGLNLANANGDDVFEMSASLLRRLEDGKTRQAQIALPPVCDTNDSSLELLSHASRALFALALELTRHSPSDGDEVK